VNVPRLPSFKNKMKARKTEIIKWGYEELKEVINESQLGIKGSATRVKKIEVPQQSTRKGKVFKDCDNETISSLISIFKENKVL